MAQELGAFEKTFDTNCSRASTSLPPDWCRACWNEGHGSIINVTTMVASKGVPGASAYSASKAAVESLTRTWAAEFGAGGVRVNSVAPGPTRTEGVAAEWGETNEELGRSLPLGRTADPEEIAHAVLFLASPRSGFHHRFNAARRRRRQRNLRSNAREPSSVDAISATMAGRRR